MTVTDKHGREIERGDTVTVAYGGQLHPMAVLQAIDRGPNMGAHSIVGSIQIELPAQAAEITTKRHDPHKDDPQTQPEVPRAGSEIRGPADTQQEVVYAVAHQAPKPAEPAGYPEQQEQEHAETDGRTDEPQQPQQDQPKPRKKAKKARN
jgi:FtsZ-interacting cell division protein ZipA